LRDLIEMKFAFKTLFPRLLAVALFQVADLYAQV
jgi:hypothetical protein